MVEFFSCTWAAMWQGGVWWGGGNAFEIMIKNLKNCAKVKISHFEQSCHKKFDAEGFPSLHLCTNDILPKKCHVSIPCLPAQILKC